MTTDRAFLEWARAAHATARATWPAITVEEEVFSAHLARKRDDLDDRSAYARLQTNDLYFALACARRSEPALRIFETEYGPALARVFARLKLPASTAADLGAELRISLFFGDTADPLLLDYAGRGAFAGWLRSIAVRRAFKTKRYDGRHVAADEVLHDLASDANPELAYVRRVHGAAFERALTEAVRELTPRERNILRQHYLDGLNIDALGVLYRVHRATAARWIADARARILDTVRAALASAMSPSELESFLRSTQRELGLRVSTLLRVEEG